MKIDDVRKNINDMSEKDQIKYLKILKPSSLIMYIQNSSIAVQMTAVIKNPFSITYIKNPSKDVQLIAVRQDGFSIYYIKNPSDVVLITALQQMLISEKIDLAKSILKKYPNRNNLELDLIRQTIQDGK